MAGLQRHGMIGRREMTELIRHEWMMDLGEYDSMDELEFEDMMDVAVDMSEDEAEDHLRLVQEMIRRGRTNEFSRVSVTPDAQGASDEEQSYYRMLHPPAAHTTASLSTAVAAAASATPAITTDIVCEGALPVEVWECIMINIDSKSMDSFAQVSKQHLAITKSPSFRARYFLARYRPCEAIFKASCLWKVFTPDVLKCLLSMGAVMSRYFVQEFCSSHFCNTSYHSSRFRATHHWATKASAKTYYAVLQEGLRLYGNKMVLNSSVSEAQHIRSWVDSATFSTTVNERVEEIFNKGRFAVFASDDDASLTRTLCTVVATHPHLIKTLETNGYRFSPSDQREIIASIFRAFEKDEEKLYTSITNMLTYLPCWKPGLMASKNVILNPCKEYFEVAPFTQAGRTVLIDNNGLGPVKASLKVVKRLYDEKRAFSDLDVLLPCILEKDLLGQRDTNPASAHIYRILFHYFPEQLQEYKEVFAVEYICQFQKKTTGPSDEDVKRATQILFDSMGDLMLSRKQLVDVLCSERIVYDKLLSAAVHAGLFGSPTSVNVHEVVGELIHACLSHPMRGARLEEVALMATEMAAELRPGGKAGQMMYEGKFEDQVAEAVLSWEFVLDYLRPDAKLANKHKLRTPLAWMVAGAQKASCSGYRYRNYVHNLPDPHQLFPSGARHSRASEEIELEFADTRQSTREQRKLEHSMHQHGQMARGERKAAKETTPPSPGWRQLGQADSFETSADDSGVCLADGSDKAAEGEEEEDDRPDQVPSSSSSASTTVAPVDSVAGTASFSSRRRKYGAWAGKIGGLPTFSMHVYRMSCTSCSSASCCSLLWPAVGPKETVTTLMKRLDADSPAMRDVVLAHALVNGNTTMIESLMAGSYEVPRQKTEEGNTTSTTETRAQAPVLPTLGHLQILQAVERKPINAFVDNILRGAPFKRGHVKASHINVRRKEENHALRREWYAKTGLKDDRSCSALYREKSRLEEVDKEARAKARKKKAASKKKGGRNDADEDGHVEFAAPVNAAGSTSVTTARRSHPARSSRKAVVYNEENAASSDAEGALDKTSERAAVATKKKVNEEDLFGVDSDLSEAEESEGIDKTREETQADSGSEEEFFDDEGDYSESIYALSAEDAPEIQFEVNKVHYSMTIKQMLRRGRSLQLWGEHMRLLMWFERRKERLMKDKGSQAPPRAQVTAAATATTVMMTTINGLRATPRGGKSKFALGVNDAIKKIDALFAEMEKQLGPALEARKKEVAKKKRSAKLKKLSKGGASSSKEKSQGEGKKGRSRGGAKKRKREQDEEELDMVDEENDKEDEKKGEGSTTAARSTKKRRVTFT